MENKLLYRYDKYTKVLLGALDALLDPMETIRVGKPVYAIPPCCTFTEPPMEEGKVALYKEETDSWELVENHIGKTVYNKKSGKELIINTFGPIPDGYSTEKVYSIQELKALKYKEIENEFKKVWEEKFLVVDEIEVELNDRVTLTSLLSAFGPFEFTTFIKGITTYSLTEEEVEQALKEIYIREMLLPKRKAALIEKVQACKGKNQVEDIEVTFDISKDFKALSKMSVEEINTYFKV